MMESRRFPQGLTTLLLLILLAILMLNGCATTTYRQGVNHLKNDEYQEAINLLNQAEQESPEDYKIKRDLGVAFFKTEQYDQAIAKLNEAKALKANDGKTVFYLGLSYEAKGELAAAINEYKNYRNLSKAGGFKKEISKRIAQLSNEKISQEINQAISQEEALDVEAIPENTVAVLYFKNMSESKDLDPLQKGLAQMLITDLSKANDLTVVERIKLQKLLEELELGSTALVEQSTAPRVGKLIGARKLVNGGFTDLAEENVRIDASLAETATTEISQVDEVTGKLDAIFKLEKNLAFRIIDDLGITLSQEEREAIEKIPTESLLAFMAYSKGLDYEDRGMFDEAKAEYQKAVELDPNFELAKEAVQQVEIAASAASAPPVDFTELEQEFSAQRETPTNPAQISRLIYTSLAAQTGQTPNGDNDTHTLQESLGTDSAVPPTVKVPIRVALP